MGERDNLIWKVVTLVCAVLLVGAVVAIVVLATGGDDGSDKKALEEQVSDLEQEVSDLEEQLADAKAELTQMEQEAEDEETSVTNEVSDRDQLEALGEQLAGDTFYVSDVVIDGDWARVSISPNDPHTAQGELCYYHKVNGTWTLVDSGTGLQYGDIPGAPASIFP
jgi:uncharacterized protein YlxW (UPF0749 family)